MGRSDDGGHASVSRQEIVDERAAAGGIEILEAKRKKGCCEARLKQRIEADTLTLCQTATGRDPKQTASLSWYHLWFVGAIGRHERLLCDREWTEEVSFGRWTKRGRDEGSREARGEQARQAVGWWAKCPRANHVGGIDSCSSSSSLPFSVLSPLSRTPFGEIPAVTANVRSRRIQCLSTQPISLDVRIHQLLSYDTHRARIHVVRTGGSLPAPRDGIGCMCYDQIPGRSVELVQPA